MKDEKVLCISLCELKAHFDMRKQSWQSNVEQIDSLEYTFIDRQKAESDFDHKQIIPYALIFNQKGEVLHYKRCGSEKRLSGLYSAGIGGHLNDLDKGDSLYGRIVNGLKREVCEEIGVEVTESQVTMLGMINEDVTKVGLCHLGIVFRIDIDDSALTFESEVGEPKWRTPDGLNLNEFELWSGLALGLTK